ncbi:MAG: hypothetical protein JO307_30250 [Bryobacterales bacterium]|nr:hypothetical protein [Bryobacterales bacterium]MBV9400419.1 hypothetical protein [Bryobacterales bacterium]
MSGKRLLLFGAALLAAPWAHAQPARLGKNLIVNGDAEAGPTLPDVPARDVAIQQNQLATPVQFLFNSTPVTPAYFGLAPGYTGVYQFNVVVPNVPANNALPISFNLGGVKGAQTLYIAVGN